MTKTLKFTVYFVFILLFTKAFGQERMLDPSSQDFDKVLMDTISSDTIKQSRTLPIVLPITEPAVGYGSVLGAGYFFPKKNSTVQPDLLTAIGGITSNESWMAGVAYFGFWNDDNLRYRGMVGYGVANVDYYGIEELGPLPFTQKVTFLSQELTWRINNSDFFLGSEFQITRIRVPIFTDSELINLDDLKFTNSGLSFLSFYDNLNNFMSPTDGMKITFSYLQNLELIGSDRNWGLFTLNSVFFFPQNDFWTPAFRLQSYLATGKVPFYKYPYVSLRGVPALRYQGDMTAVFETEQLFDVSERWGIAAFAGVGAAINSVEQSIQNEIVYNYGAGVRFLLLKSQGIKMGTDIARGPEEWAFYVSIGSAWSL